MPEVEQYPFSHLYVCLLREVQSPAVPTISQCLIKTESFNALYDNLALTLWAVYSCDRYRQLTGYICCLILLRRWIKLSLLYAPCNLAVLSYWPMYSETVPISKA